MEYFWYFLLRSSIFLLLFAAAYLILLHRKVNPVFNRFYILTTSFLSLLLPLANGYAVQVNVSQPSTATLPEVVVVAGMSYQEVTTSIVDRLLSLQVLQWGFYSVCMILFFRLLWQLGAIFRLAAKNKREKLAGMTIVKTMGENLPFSFFHWLFVGKDLIHQNEFSSVLTHEKAHYRKLHSLDILFFSFLRIVFWFHPAIYFLERELRSMHEYEADAIALKSHDKISYQKNLLSLSYAGILIPITNPFNVTLIKKRLLMMNQKTWQKPALNWFKLLLAAPLIVLVIFVQSCHFDKSTQEAEPEAQMVKSVSVNPDGTREEKMIDPMIEHADAQPISDSIFTVVQEMPVFPGGTEALMQFIASNIQYPEKALKEGIQGRVFVNFIVEADGRVSETKVLRGIGGGCDEEALRVVGMMPAWTPGKQHGKAVRVSFNLPVKFVLND